MEDKTTNCVSEWFGHRVYPHVSHRPQALQDQQARRCPFLSAAMQADRPCIKTKASHGVCTISSSSNGPRQDWLVCPYRGLERSLLSAVVESLFGQAGGPERLITPAPSLATEELRGDLIGQAKRGGHPIVYFQDKLGGEISVSKTDRSPELSFDITLAEVGRRGERLAITRFGILELQTMDFHGSYRHAVKNLEDALRLHQESFHDTLETNPQWLGDHIEGPNIANVFKRTFYQMMLKFQVASQPGCAGAVLALPAAVWDSWQRHLGAPELRDRGDFFELLSPDSPLSAGKASTWIFVFDIEVDAGKSPNRLVLSKRIATDADSIAHFALKVAPAAAFGAGNLANLIPERIKQRMSVWWPEALDLLT